MSIAVDSMDLVDSTGLLQDPAALKRRAAQEGYLFFRGLLKPEDVLPVRRQVLGILDRYGWRQSGQDDLDGAMDVESLNRVGDEQMRLDIGVSSVAYDQVQCLESFHRLPHHPRLLSLYRTLFGSDVLVHPRHIMRIVTPHRAMVPTPQHQDFPHIQGTANTWTCWFPLGDCSRELGPLTVLRSSDRQGHLPIAKALGAGGLETQLCPGEAQWLSADFAAGDVLSFPSLTVHKALPNRRGAFVRISMDVRYQSVTEPVEAGSLKPHCDLTWENIYADWKQDDLKYYWRQLPLTISPWDERFLRPSRRIC